MKLTKVLMAVAVIATLGFVSCKPKDADIAKSIQEKMAAMPDMKDMKVEVKDGVATLTGVCKDQACKDNCVKAVEGMGIKGVKSVVSNCELAPAPVAPPASTTVSSLAADVQQKIKDGLKDIKGITSIAFSDKGAVLMGEITKADNMKIKQILGAAKVVFDAAASKLTVK